MTTKHRAVAVATTAFADRGVAGTSLDWLAAELGVTKQTILYHFGSKDGLVAEVLATGARDLVDALEAARGSEMTGFARVEAVVRASFALAVARPDLLGLLRELNRLGPARTNRVLEVLQPLVDEAVAFLSSEMTAGRFRAGDPEMVLVSTYAVVTGVVADAEVLRAVGLDLDLRVAVRLRRTLLSFLEAVLLGDPATTSMR
ncbi:MAG: TetR/AcrR family transcriptional regulator [Actinomycetota bacterium]